MSLTAAQALSWSAVRARQIPKVEHPAVAVAGLDLAPLVASGPIRAAAVFLLTVAFGGAILHRSSGWIDDAVEASMARPLSSLGYGLAAYVIALFVVSYAAGQLARLGLDARILSLLGGLVIAVIVLSFGGVGFAVVGAWVTELLGERDPWAGLVGVASVSAVAWVVLPAAPAVLLWLGIAAVGLGGPTRRWIREPDADQRVHR